MIIYMKIMDNIDIKKRRTWVSGTQTVCMGGQLRTRAEW